MRRIVTAPSPDEAPRPQWEEYEALARRALIFFADYQVGFREILSAQVKVVTLDSMEYSGWGFFLKLGLPIDAPALHMSGPISARAHPRGETLEALHDIGLVLFIEGGRMTLLEAHGILEWPEDINGYEVARER